METSSFHEPRLFGVFLPSQLPDLYLPNRHNLLRHGSARSLRKHVHLESGMTVFCYVIGLCCLSRVLTCQAARYGTCPRMMNSECPARLATIMLKTRGGQMNWMDRVMVCMGDRLGGMGWDMDGQVGCGT